MKKQSFEETLKLFWDDPDPDLVLLLHKASTGSGSSQNDLRTVLQNFVF